ncbi:hypothetical protein [Pelagibacterium halotolerans]|uniref:hypothetical protein n=1 Tax=Pelagibacterium halotolerans TaxID=531813 RepID=UPI0038506B11
MKNRIRKAEGRSKTALATRIDLSTAEQIACGENEGMVTVVESPAAEWHPAPHAETTSLERRVLAHERILQSLIAHMAETNHDFLQRLQQTFRLPTKYREQDYTDTEDFAEEFVRAIEVAVQRQRARAAPKVSATGRHTVVVEIPDGAATAAKSGGFHIRKRNGVWEVRENGVFRGDYLQEQQAIAAVGEAEQYN